jgi:hypothetical protein
MVLCKNVNLTMMTKGMYRQNTGHIDEVFNAASSGTKQKAMFSLLFRGSRKSVLFRAGFLIAAIAFIDWRLVNELPLGFLYLLPMLMVGRVLSPWQIASVAALCTFLAEDFDQFAWSFRAGMPRDVLYFAAFFCVGLSFTK